MKRFTETQKWEDPWFRRLAPEMKILWQWLCDKCDNAGVIDCDLGLASFQIGYAYPMDTLSKFDGRIIELECGKWFIPKFIGFQYGEISEDCRAHNPIFSSIKKHDLQRVLEGYGYPPRKGRGKGIGKGSRQGPADEDPPESPQQPLASIHEDPPAVSFANAQAMEKRKATINAFRPNWQKLAKWTYDEDRALMQVAANIDALTDDDWKIMRGYYDAPAVTGKEFKPTSRKAFLENLASVLENATEWAKKNGKGPKRNHRLDFA